MGLISRVSSRTYRKTNFCKTTTLKIQKWPEKVKKLLTPSKVADTNLPRRKSELLFTSNDLPLCDWTEILSALRSLFHPGLIGQIQRCQISFDHRIRHEKNRRQQHPRLHRRPQMQQKSDQEGRQRIV